MIHDIIHKHDIVFSSSDNNDDALLRKDNKLSNRIFVVDSQKEKNI